MTTALDVQTRDMTMSAACEKRCDVSIFRNVVPIERRESPTRAEFEQLYLEAPGRPVILTDVVRSWQALSKWDFDFFAETFGHEEVIVSDRLIHPNVSFRMKLRGFLSYSQNPRRLEKYGNPPLYLGFQPFARRPELLDDFSQPPVASCIYEALAGELYEWYIENFGVILIGSAGTVTPLHADLYGTHGWLAQIRGRKHWLVFAPGEAANLYSGTVNLLAPDLHTFPKLGSAQAYEAVLSPGEVIFVPNGWYHHVVSLDPSISFGFNFVNQTNFLEHVLGISRDLPKWAKRINSPAFRRQLCISWTAADFALLESGPGSHSNAVEGNLPEQKNGSPSKNASGGI